MRRRYTVDDFSNLINKIKTLNADACIGVDVIVGYPSESEEDFLETYDFLKNQDVSYLHVFTYSERENTKAIEIKPTMSAAFAPHAGMRLLRIPRSTTENMGMK